jgi:hypothetical protein
MTGIGYDVHRFAENRPLGARRRHHSRTATAWKATRMPTCCAMPLPMRC